MLLRRDERWLAASGGRQVCVLERRLPGRCRLPHQVAQQCLHRLYPVERKPGHGHYRLCGDDILHYRPGQAPDSGPEGASSSRSRVRCTYRVKKSSAAGFWHLCHFFTFIFKKGHHFSEDVLRVTGRALAQHKAIATRIVTTLGQTLRIRLFCKPLLNSASPTIAVQITVQY